MENFSVRAKVAQPALGRRRQAITGVNASGNLEVLTERVLPQDESEVQVSTAAVGFRDIWQAVIADFFQRVPTGGLRFSINDGGARPDAVSLRLLQSVRLMEGEA